MKIIQYIIAVACITFVVLGLVVAALTYKTTKTQTLRIIPKVSLETWLSDNPRPETKIIDGKAVQVAWPFYNPMVESWEWTEQVVSMEDGTMDHLNEVISYMKLCIDEDTKLYEVVQ